MLFRSRGSGGLHEGVREASDTFGSTHVGACSVSRIRGVRSWGPTYLSWCAIEFLECWNANVPGMSVRGYNKRMFEPRRRTSSTLNDSFHARDKKLRRPEKAIISYFGGVGWRGWREETTRREREARHEKFTDVTLNGCRHDATKDFKNTELRTAGTS